MTSMTSVRQVRNAYETSTTSMRHVRDTYDTHETVTISYLVSLFDLGLMLLAFVGQVSLHLDRETSFHHFTEDLTLSLGKLMAALLRRPSFTSFFLFCFFLSFLLLLCSHFKTHGGEPAV